MPHFILDALIWQLQSSLPGALFYQDDNLPEALLATVQEQNYVIALVLNALGYKALWILPYTANGLAGTYLRAEICDSPDTAKKAVADLERAVASGVPDRDPAATSAMLADYYGKVIRCTPAHAEKHARDERIYEQSVSSDTAYPMEERFDVALELAMALEESYCLLAFAKAARYSAALEFPKENLYAAYRSAGLAMTEEEAVARFRNGVERPAEQMLKWLFPPLRQI